MMHKDFYYISFVERNREKKEFKLDESNFVDLLVELGIKYVIIRKSDKYECVNAWKIFFEPVDIDKDKTYFIFNFDNVVCQDKHEMYKVCSHKIGYVKDIGSKIEDILGGNNRIKYIKFLMSYLNSIGKLRFVTKWCTSADLHYLMDKIGMVAYINENSIYGKQYFNTKQNIVEVLIEEKIISEGNNVLYVDNEVWDNEQIFTIYDESPIFRLENSRYGRYCFTKIETLDPYIMFNIIRNEIIPFFRSSKRIQASNLRHKLRESRIFSYFPFSIKKEKYPLEKEKEEYPLEKEKKEYPLEKKEYPLEKEKKEYPLEKEKEEYPLEKEKKEYPLEKEKEEYSIKKYEKIDILPFEKKIEREHFIKHEKMDLPSITIGKYTFTLEGKQLYSDRHHVLVRVNDKRFMFYTSLSEGGFWRLCYLHSYLFTMYEKGKHYILSSFVHIDLQMFINNHYNNLVEGSFIDNYCKNNEKNQVLEQIINVLTSNERHISITNDPIFKILSKCKPGFCLRYQSVLYKMAEEVNKLMMEDKENENIYKKFITIYEESKSTTLLEKISSFYRAINMLMEKYYTLVKDTVIHLGKFIFKIDEESDISHEIYSVTIINNLTKTQYTLIYSRYILNVKDFDFNGEYYIIINLLPSDAQINEFGVYDKVIDVGIYVYKIMNYEDQCNISNDFNERTINVRNRCYVFIGDILNNVWPLYILQK
jgi:hypothetical protein